jgi:hypothetical protein
MRDCGMVVSVADRGTAVRVNVRVDGTDHACHAVHSLRAVEPHWLRILDADSVSEDAG